MIGMILMNYYDFSGIHFCQNRGLNGLGDFADFLQIYCCLNPNFWSLPTGRQVEELPEIKNAPFFPKILFF
jgi:hypothetical protein